MIRCQLCHLGLRDDEAMVVNKANGSEKGMAELEKVAELIRLKNEGHSNRETARLVGLNRETVSKYWEDYKRKRHELMSLGVDVLLIQEELTKKPKYDASGRKKRKYTEAIEERLKEILKAEKHKDTVLGVGHKQAMSNKQIFGMLKNEGFDIGIATINNALARLRAKPKQVFIRQMYDYGDRVEYDFGECRLVIGGVTSVYHMALFTSSAGKFRWLKLYTNQKKPVFMDSHVRFFEWAGGVFREVVYDNAHRQESRTREAWLLRSKSAE